ncbi:MAG TPA: Type 1 glutamine amidotransferase-like domain-containing protein [Anaerolineales bacterium]|nr:Type 1 glutamine amidotransferase-like domain-containing protein [Anaerolineales bacterium]
MNLHLFSTPGKDDIRYILDACRPYLEGRDEAVVAYLPAASLDQHFQELTERSFRGLARLATINTELQTLPEMEAILRDASLVYIPGGNTFLLNHRLHLCKIIEYLRRKVAAGLPVVAFSAGTVLCGPNILTTNDLNIVPTSYFKGLEATLFNFNVHYPEDDFRRAGRDEWLAEYFVFHDNPILLLEDGAYVKVEGRKTTLEWGPAWIWRHGQEKEKLTPGSPIAL